MTVPVEIEDVVIGSSEAKAFKWLCVTFDDFEVWRIKSYVVTFLIMEYLLRRIPSGEPGHCLDRFPRAGPTGIKRKFYVSEAAGYELYQSLPRMPRLSIQSRCGGRLHANLDPL